MSPVYSGPVSGISTSRVSPPAAGRVRLPFSPTPPNARMFPGAAVPPPAWVVAPAAATVRARPASGLQTTVPPLAVNGAQTASAQSPPGPLWPPNSSAARKIMT